MFSVAARVFDTIPPYDILNSSLRSVGTDAMDSLRVVLEMLDVADHGFGNADGAAVHPFHSPTIQVSFEGIHKNKTCRCEDIQSR